MSEARIRPYTLVAELTYRCPLRCVYCSNPLDYARHSAELDTATWQRVFREAEELGVVQLNLTGGEPLVRDDLEALIEEARRLDLYTNLITSGIPLRRERLARFRELGLDNVQISIQDVTAAGSDRIAGLRSFERKLEVAAWVKELGFPLTLNTVLHRDNLDHVAEVIALAERLRRRSPGAGQHAVPRLGPRQPRRAAAHPRPARARARGGGRGPAAAARPHGGPLRHARLLHRPPEGLHGRLGAPLHRRQPRRPRPALSRRAHPARASTFDKVTERAARRTSGATRPASTPSAARPGCPSRAGAASAVASTSAAVAVRPST